MRALDQATSEHGLPPMKQARLNHSTAGITGYRERQAAADKSLVIAFAATGASAHLLDNQLFKRALQLTSLVGEHFVPPNRKQVLGPMLDVVFEETKLDVEKKRQAIAPTFGLTYVSDGATAKDRTPVLNGVRIIPGQVEFVRMKDCTGQTKDKQYIADFVCEDIFSLPHPQDCVQVLMGAYVQLC
jgi:hypothetical protein